MYNNCMSSKTINISLPEELVEKIDKAAKSEYASRSDFIRESIVWRFKRSSSDRGATADFRTISPEGVPASEVLSAIQSLLNKK